jgi:hypothetical protein
VGAITIAGAAVTLAAFSVGASASTATHGHSVSHARPHASSLRNGATSASTSHLVTAFTQEFGTNTTPFCPAGLNPPCDGNGVAGHFGTIDRVPSGFSNGGFGNYAPSTKALVDGWMALVSGTQDVNQGAGCPGTTATSNPGEACTGPFALFGTGAAAGEDNVFPAKGFTVTDDLYLSPSTALPDGSLVDDDVSLNDNTGQFRIDNIITACAEPGGFVINFGNNSPGSCSGTPAITSAGWYRFVFAFSDNAGNADVTESVRSEPHATLVATSGLQPVGGTATPISGWGGPNYFWLPTEDFSGLPLANFALQLGVETAGHKP